MSLHFTAAVDYAIRGMVYLTVLDRQSSALRDEIAEACDAPPAFMAKVLRRLAAAGLLESGRGAHGGFRLARPAAEITLLHLVVAIEGPISIAPSTAFSGDCPPCGQYPADALFQRIQDAVEDSLAARTLEDLVNRRSPDDDSLQAPPNLVLGH